MKIHYIANTGFLLEHQGKKVLIDGIHTKQVDPYHFVDQSTINKIITGEAPFHNLDLLLFTHYHWDHLDGNSSLKALKNQPKLKLFSNKQTIDLLKTLPDYDPFLDEQLLFAEVESETIEEFKVNNINFSVALLNHDGTEYSDVLNFSYIIDFDGISVFHCGDAKADYLNYENLGLDKYNIDIALLDFPYISLTTGRKIINSFIKPKKILLMHLPNPIKDIYNWLKTVHKIVDRYGDTLPKMILCEDPNTEVQL